MNNSLAKGSLAQKAYEVIRDSILKGAYPLGSVLSRRQLAASLGMSILPVAEALRRLENEGLVESRPRVGTTVRVPTPQDIRGNYIVREALECQAARLFAERSTAEARAELQQKAAELDELSVSIDGDPTQAQSRTLAFRKRHMQFHMQIAQATGYPALAQALEKNHVLVFVALYDSLLGGPSDPPEWHSQLMRALCQKDPNKAQEAMRAHVRFGLESLLNRLEPYLRWDEDKLNSLKKKRWQP